MMRTSNPPTGTPLSKGGSVLPFKHGPLSIDGETYDLSHLDAFAAAIPKKGIEDSTHLGVVVVFSNHVFTERAKHDEQHHALDHYGYRRRFDADRYATSITLPAAVRKAIENNELTHISTSFGDIDNLVFVQTEDGATWAVVYCLFPIKNNTAVRMEILSFHPKRIEKKNLFRRNLSYFARKCLFDKERVPK